MKFCMFLLLALSSSILQLSASPNPNVHYSVPLQKFKPYLYARYAWHSTNGSEKYQDYLLKAKFPPTDLEAYKHFFAERENINVADLMIHEIEDDAKIPGGRLSPHVPKAYTCIKTVLMVNTRPYVFHNNELAIYS